MKTAILTINNPINDSLSRWTLILIPFVLMWVALLPETEAVLPAPGGGYAGGNTAEGQNALLSLTSGTFNTAVGFFSLRSDTENNFNTGVGAGSLFANTADDNTATGAGALLSNTIASDNTANGAFALLSNTIGFENTACGASALRNTTNGGGNTAVGFQALANNTTGVTNTALGFNCGFDVTTADNVIVIGTNVGGANVDHSCFIGEIFGQTSSSGTAVFINSDGRLGTMTSSRRFKEAIEPMDQTSETLFALKPVRFRYKKEIDPNMTSQFGLVAEDVEKVDPALVVRDKEGKPYSVRYEQVNAMLLNEFLKEHKAFVEEQHKVENLQGTVAQQQRQIETLTVGFAKSERTVRSEQSRTKNGS